MSKNIIEDDSGACRVPSCPGSNSLKKISISTRVNDINNGVNITNTIISNLCDLFINTYLNIARRFAYQRNADYNGTINFARASCRIDVNMIGLSVKTNLAVSYDKDDACNI